MDGHTLNLDITNLHVKKKEKTSRVESIDVEDEKEKFTFR